MTSETSTLSPTQVRALTNRVAHLRNEALLLRKPMKGQRPISETETRAADLADQAATAAEAALSGNGTSAEASNARNVYNDYLDANPSVRRVMGWM